MRTLDAIARIIGQRLWIRMDDAGQQAAEQVLPEVQALRLRRAAYQALRPVRSEREIARLRTCRAKVEKMIEDFEKEKRGG